MPFPLRLASGFLTRATRAIAVESAPTQRILRNNTASQCRAYTQAQRPRCEQSMRSMIISKSQFSTSMAREKQQTMGQMRQRHTNGPFSWKAALLFVLTSAGMVLYFRMEKARLERKRMAEMTKGVGKPKVGGPFVLKDLDGKEFTAEDLKGKYSFVSVLAMSETISRSERDNC